MFLVSSQKNKMEFLKLHHKRNLPLRGIFLTFLNIVLLYGLFHIPLIIELNLRQVEDVTDFFNAEVINLNYALFLFMLVFLGGGLGLLISIKRIHEGTFLSLITSGKTIDYSRIRFGFYVWGFLIIMSFIIDYFFVSGSSEMVYNGLSINFFIAIFVSFILLSIQSSIEELVCRGYLMQALGYIFKRRWLPILISGLFFGFLHIGNPEVAKFGTSIMLLHYCSVGVFLGIIVVMDNRLELALGFHAVNNILSGLLVNFDGAAFKTYALFTTSSIDPYLGYVTWLVSAVIFYIWCSVRYKWNSLSFVLKKMN